MISIHYGRRRQQQKMSIQNNSDLYKCYRLLYILAPLFYKTEEVLSPPARRHCRLHLHPLKFWGKIVKAKDHVQFYIKFDSESFHICCVDSYCCTY